MHVDPFPWPTHWCSTFMETHLRVTNHLATSISILNDRNYSISKLTNQIMAIFLAAKTFRAGSDLPRLRGGESSRLEQGPRVRRGSNITLGISGD